MEFSRKEYWSGLPFPTPEDLPDPGIEPASPMSPALHADSLLTEPSGKLKNIGVDCQSILQGIFLTQGLNPGLLHCKQIFFFFIPSELPGKTEGSGKLQCIASQRVGHD